MYKERGTKPVCAVIIRKNAATGRRVCCGNNFKAAVVGRSGDQTCRWIVFMYVCVYISTYYRICICVCRYVYGKRANVCVRVCVCVCAREE